MTHLVHAPIAAPSVASSLVIARLRIIKLDVNLVKIRSAYFPHNLPLIVRISLILTLPLIRINLQILPNDVLSIKWLLDIDALFRFCIGGHATLSHLYFEYYLK